jgi:hypothetical protein
MGYSDSKLEIAAQNGYSPRNSPEFQRLESQYSGVLRTMDQMQEAIDVLTEYNEVCDETIQRGRRDYQNLHRRYAQDMNALKNSLIDKSLLDTVQSEKEAYKREVERLQLSMTLDGVKSKGYEEFEKKIFDFLSAYYAACTPNLNVDSTMQSRVAAIRSAIKRNSLNGSANDIANLAERMITRSSNSCLENHMKEAKRLFSNSSKVPSSSNYLVQNLLDSYQSVINVWRD